MEVAQNNIEILRFSVWDLRPWGGVIEPRNREVVVLFETLYSRRLKIYEKNTSLWLSSGPKFEPEISD